MSDNPRTASARRPVLWLTLPVAFLATARSEPGPRGEAIPQAWASVPATPGSLRRDPYDPAAVAAQSAALCDAGKAAAAVDYLMELKAQYYDFFPHQPALAAAFARAGMLEDAALAWSVVGGDARYSPAQRETARAWQRQAAAPVAVTMQLTKPEKTVPPRPGPGQPPAITPEILFETRPSSQREGTLWTSGIELHSGSFSGGGNVFFLRGIWDDIGLGEPQLITQTDADRFQVEAAWRRLMARGFSGEISAGDSSSGGTWGALISREQSPGNRWELRFRSRDRAADSLLLLALGGTEDTASIRIRHRPAERWMIDAKAGWRRVAIDHTELGEGVTLDFRLVYTLMEEKDGRAGLTAGYFAEVQSLDRPALPPGLLQQMMRLTRRKDDPADQLLDDRINRHGLVLTLTKPLGAHWSSFLYGGVAYEFEAGRAEARAGAGVTACLTRNASLIFAVDYASSGNAANKGSDVTAGTAKLRVSF